MKYTKSQKALITKALIHYENKNELSTQETKDITVTLNKLQKMEEQYIKALNIKRAEYQKDRKKQLKLILTECKKYIEEYKKEKKRNILEMPYTKEKREVIKKIDMSFEGLAKQLNLTRQTVSKYIKEDNQLHYIYKQIKKDISIKSF